MKKQVTFNKDASTKLIEGVNIICDAVRSTLGAGGRIALIEDFYGNPQATKDGFTLAKSIELSDHIQNMGCSLIKQVASKTVQTAGDGTTTACLLAQAIINKGFEAIENGANPIELICDIKSSSLEIIKNIRSQSIPIKGNWERVKQVAVISTNGDEHHASLLVDAMQKIGDDGVVLIEQGSGFETKVEIVKGLEFDSGYLSPFFINNEKNECVLENPYIFITTATISYMEEVIKALEVAMSKQRPIIFISNNIDGEGQAALLTQKIKGKFPLCAVNAPSFGEKRKEHLIDIATATGGSIFGSEFGKEMKNSKEADFGTCEKIIISKDKTIIIGGAGDKERIEKRIESIRTTISEEENPTEKEWMKQRLAKLSGGIAIMKIGGVTQVSISEIKDRVDDALCATRAAIEEGIVPGGGIAYIQAINNPQSTDTINRLMVDSCLEPFSQILKNAGMEVTFERNGGNNIGMNVRTRQWEDFLETGIIDSTKVCVSALENAVDVACLILQNNCIVTNILEEKVARQK